MGHIPEGRFTNSDTPTHTISTFFACLHDAGQDDKRSSMSPVSILDLALQAPPLLSPRADTPGCRLPQQIQTRLWGLQCPSGSGW
ncbi:hypothetical protein FIBSPDRAFT_287443 [Athelia psychrophila]|uniref:Uncharacterized protein n=1 Tax=Athelia psychrophila TaxID=1759441 RepID=A0A167XNA8_9AGAM|nr:hypothetical protein FIBSPDRAFT_287443 [Fibularhizoctonia sp. CBS 109695]